MRVPWQFYKIYMIDKSHCILYEAYDNTTKVPYCKPVKFKQCVYSKVLKEIDIMALHVQ